MAGTDIYLPETIDIDDHTQGDTFPGARFTVTRNGVAKDITGATITMTFLQKNNKNLGTTQVLVTGAGVTIVDGPNAVFDMDEIPGADMDWPVGEYHYQVRIVYADSFVKSPIDGTLKIVQKKATT